MHFLVHFNFYVQVLSTNTYGILSRLVAMSSKWPNDIETFKCMRLEFFFEISKLLSKKHKVNCKVNVDFLDVIYNGYVFRIRAYNAKEAVLLQKTVNEKGNIVYKDTEEAFKLNAQLHVLPSICGALMGYDSISSSTTRLMGLF